MFQDTEQRIEAEYLLRASVGEKDVGALEAIAREISGLPRADALFGLVSGAIGRLHRRRLIEFGTFAEARSTGDGSRHGWVWQRDKRSSDAIEAYVRHELERSENLTEYGWPHPGAIGWLALTNSGRVAADLEYARRMTDAGKP